MDLLNYTFYGNAVRQWVIALAITLAVLVGLRLLVSVVIGRVLALSKRTRTDWDDLVAHAIAALRLDPDYLARLQHRWPFILEDEAQDSSELQQDLLAALAGPNGNWVRVGDPNQAVYYTFTTANPRLLRDFLRRSDVTSVDMPESGRSARPIMDVANYLVDWAVAKHPLPEVRDAFRQQHVLPTPEGDPMSAAANAGK